MLFNVMKVDEIIKEVSVNGQEKWFRGRVLGVFINQFCEFCGKDIILFVYFKICFKYKVRY